VRDPHDIRERRPGPDPRSYAGDPSSNGVRAVA
jgi:hypothetical protein